MRQVARYGKIRELTDMKHSCACSNNRNAWRQAFRWVRELNKPKPVPKVTEEPEVTCRGLEPTETKV